MNVLGLFSGIGGFELGFERAGFNIAVMCEIEPYCRAVLKKHWPRVPVYEDVRELTADRLRSDGIAIDVITGGFPCQDISLAGKGAGLGGERSGLWSEYRRLIEEVAPRWVVIENVSALRSRGLDTVLGQLAALGYDAEWHCIPASAVGAPHRRDRIWIVAYPHRQGEHAGTVDAEMGSASEPLAYPTRVQPGWPEQWTFRERARPSCQPFAVAYPQQQGLEGRPCLAGYLAGQLAAVERGGAVLADTNGAGCGEPFRPGAAVLGAGTGEPSRPDGCGRHPWLSEPNVGRVANGVPSRVDRLRALGNAVVPQIPEIIARAILQYESDRSLLAAA